ncbi:MAG: helix-turn-helix domain-containing protein [Candidatus Thermoplasmatota archaeon]|nr:helix-turn-helix domain-containing protein [Candidatus Thermoplasmatota archaeon]
MTRREEAQMDVKFRIKNKSCSLSGLYSEFGVNSRVIKKEMKDGIVYEIAEIYYKKNDLEKILASIRSSSEVINVDTLYSNQNILIVKLTTEECPILGIIKKYSGEGKSSFTKEEKIDEGENVWYLSMTSVELVKELSERLRDATGNDVMINIYKKSKVDKKSLFIVKEAYDLGFFDVPKRINLLELSATLNIPPTTLDLIIRKSLKYFLDVEIASGEKLQTTRE